MNLRSLALHLRTVITTIKIIPLSFVLLLLAVSVTARAAVFNAADARLASIDAIANVLQVQQADRGKKKLLQKQLQSNLEQLQNWQGQSMLPAPVEDALDTFKVALNDTATGFSLPQAQRLMNQWRALDELLAAMALSDRAPLDQALASMDLAFAMQNLGYLLQQWPALSAQLPEANTAAVVQRDTEIRKEINELENLVPGERLLEKLKSRYALVSAKVLEPDDNYSPPLVMFFTSSMRDMLDKIAFRAQLRAANA